MIENKLLHFRTRQAFENALSQIGQNSVAFVDEGRTIYTHGVEYNCDYVRQYIDQIYNEINSSVETVNSHLEDLINELNQYVRDTINQNVQDTINRIKDAEDLINEVQERLNGLQSDSSTWGLDINELKTKVTAFSNWYDTTQQTLTNLSATVNRVDGSVSGFSQIIDTINNTVNTFTASVNAKLGELEYEFSHINVDDQIRTIIGREISASDGLLHDFVKSTDIDIDGTNITSVIEQWFQTYDINGSNNPSWNALVARVNNNENALTTIRQKVGNDYAALTGLSQWKTDTTNSISALRQEVATGVSSDEVDAIVENYINNSSALAQLRTWATNLNSNTQSGFSLSAVIKSLTNANGEYISDQELSAAYIQGINNNNNTSIKIHADQIQLDGSAIFDILSGTSTEQGGIRAYTDIYRNGRAVFADLDRNDRVSILPSENKALIVQGNSRFDGDIEASYITCRNDLNAGIIHGKGLYITTDANGTPNQQIITANESSIILNMPTEVSDLLRADSMMTNDLQVENSSIFHGSIVFNGQIQVKDTTGNQPIIANGVTQEISILSRERLLWEAMCNFETSVYGLSDPGHIYGDKVFKLKTYDNHLESEDNYLLEYDGTDTTFRYCIAQDVSQESEDYELTAVIPNATLDDIKSALFVDNDSARPYIFVWLDNKNAGQHKFYFTRKLSSVTLKFVNGICTSVR